jgi:hypothetical protein
MNFHDSAYSANAISALPSRSNALNVSTNILYISYSSSSLSSSPRTFLAISRNAFANFSSIFFFITLLLRAVAAKTLNFSSCAFILSAASALDFSKFALYSSKNPSIPSNCPSICSRRTESDNSAVLLSLIAAINSP